jgi:septal ring factor EnvC (AmiA/AmiB activator)
MTDILINKQEDKGLVYKNHICNICNKVFSCSTSLRTHQKSAKSCKKNMDINIPKTSCHKCTYCNKDFATKQVLICHHNSCIELIKHNYEEKLSDLNKKLSSDNKECSHCKELEMKLNNEISNYKKQMLQLVENQNKLIDKILNNK